MATSARPCALEVGRLRGRPAEQPPQREAERAAAEQLEDGAEQGEAAQPAQRLQRELHAQREEEEDDADLGERADALRVAHEAGRERADHDAGREVADQRRLA
jgi:hypothetical protein